MDSSNEKNDFSFSVYPVNPHKLIEQCNVSLQQFESKHAIASTFSEMLKSYMKHPVKVTQEELSERTGISVSTIHRMLAAEKMNYNPSIQNVLACIVGLHIDCMGNQKLLELAGYNLNLETRRNRLYRQIIGLFYNASVVECNNFLEYYGEKPLTKNENITSAHAIDWNGRKLDA